MGAQNLANYKEPINKLNVFPVPDGDTGTNMNLSMQSGVRAIQKAKEATLSSVLQAYVNGLLMGARGNSGVILSQLFKGFSDALQGKTEINSEDLAQALIKGVDVAYQAVTNPVEGTILTVAKDAAQRAKGLAGSEGDIIHLMAEILKEAQAALERTPDQLPILKEVGVVDSGGKGLVVIYEGFLAALMNKDIPEADQTVDIAERIAREHDKAVQGFVDPATIEYGYCTEFLLEFDHKKLADTPFQKDQFRNVLSEFGDSLLVAVTDDLVKVHIHTENPGKVMEIAQQYGDLNNIDIENMRKQYEEIVKAKKTTEQMEELDVAIIAVALGSGMKKMLLSIGATCIIEGGQTMNPSTEDILQAIKQTNAKETYVLPNNKNIFMAAKQAQALSEKSVVVLPAKSIPQGIAALFAFDDTGTMETNEQQMIAAMQGVKTGLITYATRDTVVNHLSIQKNAFIGMNDETIITTDENKVKTTQLLLEQLIDEDDEIVTVFFGEDVTEEEKLRVKHFAEETFADVEMEYHNGDQALYPFIIMIE